MPNNYKDHNTVDGYLWLYDDYVWMFEFRVMNKNNEKCYMDKRTMMTMMVLWPSFDTHRLLHEQDKKHAKYIVP